jgi:penicillin V acylase-like amidase (Ntn superfamily)
MNMPIGTQKEDMGSPSNDQWKKEKEHDNDELFFSRDDDESVNFFLLLNIHSSL